MSKKPNGNNLIKLFVLLYVVTGVLLTLWWEFSTYIPLPFPNLSDPAFRLFEIFTYPFERIFGLMIIFWFLNPIASLLVLILAKVLFGKYGRLYPKIIALFFMWSVLLLLYGLSEEQGAFGGLLVGFEKQVSGLVGIVINIISGLIYFLWLRKVKLSTN